MTAVVVRLRESDDDDGLHVDLDHTDVTWRRADYSSSVCSGSVDECGEDCENEIHPYSCIVCGQDIIGWHYEENNCSSVHPACVTWVE